MNLTSIDGIIGAGKAYLLGMLKYDNRFTGDLEGVGFIEEPVEKFQTYKSFNPLKEFYTNPKENAATCQLYFLDVMNETYTKHLSSQKHCYLTERNMYSTAVFTSTLFCEGMITDFQYEYILDKDQERIKQVLPPDCSLGCNRLIYLNTDTDTCLKRIQYRVEESHMEEMRHYLKSLQSEYEKYYTDFIETNGSDKAEQITEEVFTDCTVEKIKELIKA